MIAATYPANACFEAWIHCEELLRTITHVPEIFSKKIAKVVDECALICMTTFHALKTKSVNIGNYALLCMGICEECAELCDELKGEHFMHCAKVCRHCSETMSEIIPLSS